jgi:uroporphyrinogen-III synthase
MKGARVLVTRAAEDCAALEELLQERGAIPVRMPCIAFEEGAQAASLAERAKQADLVVLASPHAARRFRQLVAFDVAVATVGAATALELGREALVPRQGAGAEALLAELGESVRGKSVLLPRAEGGNPELVAGLQRAGARVETLTLYRTVPAPSADPAALAQLREGRIDAVAFASGSAARGFASLAGTALSSRTVVACMGKLCAGEARAAGLRVDAVNEGGLAGLCDAVVHALSRRG